MFREGKSLFEWLPRDMILEILNFLKASELVTFAQASKQGKGFAETPLKRQLTQTINELIAYNPHDLYFAALRNQGIALIVVATPALAKKISQRIYGGHYANAKLDDSYEIKREKNQDHYNKDILYPLYTLACKYMKVAEIIVKDNYPFKIGFEDTNALIEAYAINKIESKRSPR